MTPRIKYAPLVIAIAMLASCKQPAAPTTDTTKPASIDAPAAAGTTTAAPMTSAGPTTTAAPASAQVPTTKDVPALVIATVDGKQFDLSAHRGKWVVVNFWATWCGPCLKEMPALSALDTMREYIDVVGLAYEDTTPAQMLAFLKKHPVSYPIAMVDVYNPPKDFETPAGLPMTYLIAPDGKVAKRFVGPVEPQDIEAAIVASGGPTPAKGA